MKFMEQERDEQLWQQAKKRAGFQRSLAAYFIVNVLLWSIWWITLGRKGYNADMPWPLWTTLGWGIGLLFQYLNAYGGSNHDLVEKEYLKLKNKN